jgi:rhodanese-related sulfurtransferase
MRQLLAALAIGLMSLTASASELGISAKEAYEKVKQPNAKVLFIDVRDPVEIMFTGFTDLVTVNIPYLIVDRTVWDDRRGNFKPNYNPNFVADVKAELAKRGWGLDTEIITMCRSGSERGEPSADFLRDNGMVNARYVINGFQGAAIKDGPQAGFRLQNGWQNSGLPWSPKMNKDKMYGWTNK